MSENKPPKFIQQNDIKLKKSSNAEFKIDLYIEKYINHCTTSDWLDNELYKFQWANWLNTRVDFTQHSNEEILQLCKQSQEKPYSNGKGVQFIKSEAREKLSKFIGMEDVKIFRQFYEGEKLKDLDFSKRNMSYPIFSCWLSTLFPNKIYPASKTGFAQVARNLFNAELSNSRNDFVLGLQETLNLIAEKLKKESGYKNLLKTKLKKTELDQLDFNWAAQDVLLFLERNSKKLKHTKEEKKLLDIIDIHSKNDLINFFNFADEIFDEIKLSQDDDRFVASTSNNQLNITIGQRYVWNLYPPQRKKGKFGIISTHKINSQTYSYEGGNPPAFYTDFQNYRLVKNNKKEVFKAIENELNRSQKSGYSKSSNAAFIKAIFDKDYREQILNSKTMISSEVIKVKASKKPLNQILYGPPGTGKTYHTINYALEICGVETDGFSREELKKRYKELVETGQIVFTTFHQSTVYEDFIEGIKPLEPEKEGDSIVYKVIDGTFKTLAINARTPGHRSFDEAYHKLIESLASSEPEDILELKTPTGKTFGISLNRNENLNLHTGKSQIKQGTLTKEKLLKEINGEKEFIGWEGYFQGVLNYLGSDCGYNTNRNLNSKNYVLIIDEINRGNVSAIFGELITLIEEDKRLGNDEALTVTLPYSKDTFSVPPNLFILGTMNTADRSVEALDTALRRRFSFVEMPPKPQKIKEGKGMEEIEGVNLSRLLTTINKRIERLLDKDHMIGHSYFMNLHTIEDLKKVFYNKVLPLLQEYFFGDYGKIGLVLGEGFFELTTDNNQDIFASFHDYDSNAMMQRNVYHLKNINKMTDKAFVEALQNIGNA